MRVPDGQSQFIYDSPCREQVNTGGESVYINSERTDYIFKSLIWIPKVNGAHRYLPGEKVNIVGESGETRIEGICARFEFGNLEENRLWI